MTPAEIAAMVADIDELEADTPLTVLSHVRALAAEVKKRDAELLSLRDSVSANSLTVYDSIAIARGTRAQLEAVTRDLATAKEKLTELHKQQAKHNKWAVQAIDKLEACDRYKAALESIASDAEECCVLSNNCPNIAREALKGATK